MFNLEIKNFLQDLSSGANHLGHKVYIVGGYVRNLLIDEFYSSNKSKNYYDIDLVIDTNAILFAKGFQRFYEDSHPQHMSYEISNEFKQFGTVKIKHPEYPRFNIEIASTRTEVYEEPADFPKVTIIDDIKKDIPRRDFTINGLLISLNKNDFGEIIDYCHGINDIQNGLIRVFHADSFVDDPTRIYRAIRFACEFDFKIESNTLEYLKKATSSPLFSSWLTKRKNRFEIELKKIFDLDETQSSRAIDLLKSLKAI
jgi:tRNA nucleotidyltransferase (CCA-adding enzyme)